jgi:hypothetical protein
MLVDVSSMCSAIIIMVLQSQKRSSLVGLLDPERLRQRVPWKRVMADLSTRCDMPEDMYHVTT